MNPFCNKFYSKSEVQLKLCQNNFCLDCCTSELKITGGINKHIKILYFILILIFNLKILKIKKYKNVHQNV